MSRINFDLRIAVIALLVSLGMACHARAIDIRVDFNHELGAPSGWNVVQRAIGGGSGSLDLIDFNTTASTGISLSVHDPFNTSTTTDSKWSDSPAYRSWIDTEANRDSFWVRQSDNPTGGVTLSGLDDNKTYRIEMVGSRQDPTSRDFQATVNGLFSDNLNSNPFNAATDGFTGHQVMSWRQLTAENGEIVVALDAAGQHGYLNALRLTEAPPQTVLIDFGDDSLTTPGRWNNITGTTTGGVGVIGHKLIGAVDAAGQETNVRVNFLSGFGETNANGVESDAAGFAVTGQRDAFLLQNTAPSATVQIEGLRPGGAYDLSLFGSRETPHAGADRITRFAIGGTAIDLTISGNAENVASFPGLVADQHGHIQIDVSVPGGLWGHLGALKIAGRFAPKAHHPSLFFDFGHASYQTPGHWNNVTTIDAGLKIEDAINSIGEPTGVSLTFAGEFSSIGAGSTQATGGSWSTAAGFPVSAQRDAFLVQAARQIQLDGLIPGAEYEVRLFGSRHNDSYARTTDFRVGTATGGWSDWITLDTAFNTENVVQFITRPDALGELLVEARRMPGGAWGYLGVMQITQVPEPGSAALLLAGALCLMLRRRRGRQGG